MPRYFDKMIKSDGNMQSNIDSVLKSFSQDKTLSFNSREDLIANEEILIKDYLEARKESKKSVSYEQFFSTINSYRVLKKVKKVSLEELNEIDKLSEKAGVALLKYLYRTQGPVPTEFSKILKGNTRTICSFFGSGLDEEKAKILAGSDFEKIQKLFYESLMQFDNIDLSFLDKQMSDEEMCDKFAEFGPKIAPLTLELENILGLMESKGVNINTPEVDKVKKLQLKIAPFLEFNLTKLKNLSPEYYSYFPKGFESLMPEYCKYFEGIENEDFPDGLPKNFLRVTNITDAGYYNAIADYVLNSKTAKNLINPTSVITEDGKIINPEQKVNIGRALAEGKKIYVYYGEDTFPTAYTAKFGMPPEMTVHKLDIEKDKNVFAPFEPDKANPMATDMLALFANAEKRPKGFVDLQNAFIDIVIKEISVSGLSVILSSEKANEIKEAYESYISKVKSFIKDHGNELDTDFKVSLGAYLTPLNVYKDGLDQGKSLGEVFSNTEWVEGLFDKSKFDLNSIEKPLIPEKNDGSAKAQLDNYKTVISYVNDVYSAQLAHIAKDKDNPVETIDAKLRMMDSVYRRLSVSGGKSILLGKLADVIRENKRFVDVGNPEFSVYTPINRVFFDERLDHVTTAKTFEKFINNASKIATSKGKTDEINVLSSLTENVKLLKYEANELGLDKKMLEILDDASKIPGIVSRIEKIYKDRSDIKRDPLGDSKDSLHDVFKQIGNIRKKTENYLTGKSNELPSEDDLKGLMNEVVRVFTINTDLFVKEDYAGNKSFNQDIVSSISVLTYIKENYPNLSAYSSESIDAIKKSISQYLESNITNYMRAEGDESINEEINADLWRIAEGAHSNNLISDDLMNSYIGIRLVNDPDYRKKSIKDGVDYFLGNPSKIDPSGDESQLYKIRMNQLILASVISAQNEADTLDNDKNNYYITRGPGSLFYDVRGFLDDKDKLQQDQRKIKDFNKNVFSRPEIKALLNAKPEEMSSLIKNSLPPEYVGSNKSYRLPKTVQEDSVESVERQADEDVKIETFAKLIDEIEIRAIDSDNPISKIPMKTRDVFTQRKFVAFQLGGGVGYKQDNSNSYKDVQDKLAEITSIIRNYTEVSAYQCAGLYLSLKNYINTHSPMPGSDVGKERFSAALDMFMEIGNYIIDKAPEYSKEIFRDFKNTAVRSVSFRRKLNHNTQSVELRSFTEIIDVKLKGKGLDVKLKDDAAAESFLNKFKAENERAIRDSFKSEVKERILDEERKLLDALNVKGDEDVKSKAVNESVAKILYYNSVRSKINSKMGTVSSCCGVFD